MLSKEIEKQPLSKKIGKQVPSDNVAKQTSPSGKELAQSQNNKSMGPNGESVAKPLGEGLGQEEMTQTKTKMIPGAQKSASSMLTQPSVFRD